MGWYVTGLQPFEAPVPWVYGYGLTDGQIGVGGYVSGLPAARHGLQPFETPDPYTARQHYAMRGQLHYW